VYLTVSPRAIPEKWPWSDKPTTSMHLKPARLWLPLLRTRYINFCPIGKQCTQTMKHYTWRTTLLNTLSRVTTIHEY
jgi:hypothetical protein